MTPRNPRISHGILTCLLALLLLVSACSQDDGSEPATELTDDFDIQGHRGARGLKPENTLPAFEIALDLGVDTLELDLHLSGDGEVVIWHDAALGSDKCRFSDSYDGEERFPSAGVPIARSSSDQFRDYSCDLNPDSGRFDEQKNGGTTLAGADYRPITLIELFEFVSAYQLSSEKSEEQRAGAARVEYNIETKRNPDRPAVIGDDFDGVNPGAFELAVLAIVEDAGLTDRVVIQSFDHRSLWAIRSVNSDIRLAALTSRDPSDLSELAARGADIWSPTYKVLNPRLVELAHQEGLLVIPWTVNRLDDMNDLVAMGVDGLITDRPDIASELGE